MSDGNGTDPNPVISVRDLLVTFGTQTILDHLDQLGCRGLVAERGGDSLGRGTRHQMFTCDMPTSS